MKTIQLLLPDNLDDQLQRKATEAGFDLSAYVLALGKQPREIRKDERGRRRAKKPEKWEFLGYMHG